MKKIDIPYIGIKIESMPTILKVLSESSDDDEFISHFIKIGKKEKTAKEYLASLRNLKLADKHQNNQTKINMNGKNLINDDISYFYKKLYKHLLKNYPDLKIIYNIIKKYNPKSLDKLNKYINMDGYYIKRKATLSSYFKLFYEADFRNRTIKSGPDFRQGDFIELNQFYKILCLLMDDDRIVKFDKFFSYINLEKKQKNIKYDVQTIIKYLKILDNERKIKLYEVHALVGQKDDNVIKIDNNYYYYLEVLVNANN